MTPAPSAEQPPSVFRLTVSLLLAVVVALYASSYFFLWSIQRSPYQASPATILRYGYHYWQRPDVRPRIGWSAAAGFGVVGLVGLVVALPRRHADCV